MKTLFIIFALLIIAFLVTTYWVIPYFRRRYKQKVAHYENTLSELWAKYERLQFRQPTCEDARAIREAFSWLDEEILLDGIESHIYYWAYEIAQRPEDEEAII